MSLLPYTYDPVTQDLWLYEDYTVNVTVPSPYSFVAKRPIAWNPDSVLYGYRRSIEGLTATLRTFSTWCGSEYEAMFGSYNDPALAVNKPIYYNSYPPHFRLVSSKFCFGCSHCYGFGNYRNPDYRMVGTGGYAIGSIFDKTIQFRFIDGDNNVVADVSPQNVLPGFRLDSNYPNLFGRSDLNLFEFVTPVSVSPVLIVDPRTQGVNASRMWFIDTNYKIIRLKQINSWSVASVDHYQSVAVSPDGNDLPEDVVHFLHDSGGMAVVEISPPSSREAGDGVLGVFAAHVESGGHFVSATIVRDGYEDLPSQGNLGSGGTLTHIRDYCAWRGYAMPSRVLSRRQTGLSSQSTDQHILDTLNSIEVA